MYSKVISFVLLFVTVQFSLLEEEHFGTLTFGLYLLAVHDKC